MWSGGKGGDNIKVLPIAIKSWHTNKAAMPYLDATKEEILAYFLAVEKKSENFFNSLTEKDMNTPIAEDNNEFTYLDVVNMRLRYVMHHVGYDICILREYADIDIEWISHNG